MHRTLLPKISILFIILFSVFLSDVFGQTKALGEVDITKCWSYPTGDAAGEILTSDGSRVFLGLGGARVEALSLDGKKMWSTELGGAISSNILAINSGLFLVTSTVSSDPTKSGGSVLRSLSKETGITNWTVKLSDASQHFVSDFNGSVVIVSKSGAIESIDVKNGNVRWARQISKGFVAVPVFSSGKSIVATSGKQIFWVSLATGEIDSMRKTQFGVTALGETKNGETIAGDERGNVSLLVNGTDKPYWTFKSGGEISSIFAVGDHLLVTSHDNFVYFLGITNGGRAWKKRMSGRISQIAIVMEQYALISSFEEHGAILTDLSNGKVAGQIAFGEDENPVTTPVISNGLIFALTNEAAYAYSLSGCPVKK